MAYKPYKTNKMNRTNKTYSLAEFIRSWDFANPRWENLPEGFLHCDTSALTTKQERHLYDAIKTMWLVSSYGRKVLYKTVAKRAVVGMTAVILLILLGRALAVSPDKKITRSVSAKTVSEVVEDIVVSTMSAIFR